jgi:hypothetical protein
MGRERTHQALQIHLERRLAPDMAIPVALHACLLAHDGPVAGGRLDEQQLLLGVLPERRLCCCLE